MKRILYILVFYLFCLGTTCCLADTTDTTLSTLRIDEEGLTPAFSPTVYDYYYTAPLTITDITITAIPENPDASVEITGNTNIPVGNSSISIRVTSPDSTQASTYTIYVIKTDQPETANTNLETLAVENIELYPAFESTTTHYTATAPFSMENLHLLAIPSDEKATVHIQQSDTLSIGTNHVSIIVTAANGTTTKQYVLQVYRRTAEEQGQYENAQLEQVQMLQAIYDTTPEARRLSAMQSTSSQQGQTIFFYMVVPVFILLCLLFITIVYVVNTHKKAP